ncbi:MAG: hypothetical protein D6832_00750 [Alphaproteobacteria bacterium]|nr:MAG: hypothetical protein D6832_00750 [Alphaproteobacteria bacterium]
MDDREQASLDRQARQAAVVIVVTALGWIAVNLVGSAAGVAPRWMFLADFAALAAFAWSFIVLYRVRRRSRQRGGE